MSKKLAHFLSSLTIIILGPILFLNYMSIDYNSVISACQVLIPAAILMGGFGFLIGKVLETSNNGDFLGMSGNKEAQFNIDDLLKPPEEIQEKSFEKSVNHLPSYLDGSDLELIDNLEESQE